MLHVPGWDSRVSPRSQGSFSPQELSPRFIPTPGNVPRARPSPGLSVHRFIPAFFCRCHHPVPPPRPGQEPALPSSHQPHPSWRFGVVSCFLLQETPNQSPFLQLGGALGRRQGRRRRCRNWARCRAGRTGRAGWAVPLAPRHAVLAAIAVPAPPRVAARPRLNYRSLITASHRATQAVVARCHRGCPAPLLRARGAPAALPAWL